MTTINRLALITVPQSKATLAQRERANEVDAFIRAGLNAETRFPEQFVDLVTTEVIRQPVRINGDPARTLFELDSLRAIDTTFGVHPYTRAPLAGNSIKFAPTALARFYHELAEGYELLGNRVAAAHVRSDKDKLHVEQPHWSDLYPLEGVSREVDTDSNRTFPDFAHGNATPEYMGTWLAGTAGPAVVLRSNAPLDASSFSAVLGLNTYTGRLLPGLQHGLGFYVAANTDTEERGPYPA